MTNASASAVLTRWCSLQIFTVEGVTVLDSREIDRPVLGVTRTALRRGGNEGWIVEVLAAGDRVVARVKIIAMDDACCLMLRNELGAALQLRAMRQRHQRRAA